MSAAAAGSIANRDAAFLGGKGARHDGEHDAEAGAGKPEPHQEPGRDVERERGGRLRHRHEAQRVGEAPHREHASRAEAIGDRAREGHRESPYQVLQRDREGEDFPAPSQVDRHRAQEEAKALPRAEGQQENDSTAREHHGRCAPVGAPRLRARPHRASVGEIGKALHGRS
jgi:hypothetical protein